MANPTLTLERTVLEVELRPWPQPEDPSHPKANSVSEEVTRIYRLVEDDWPERLSHQSPAKVSLNVFRVGDVVFCTNPVEFFVEFGLEIKHWSTAEMTFVVELTDGYAGYAPTLKAFGRGAFLRWERVSKSSKRHASCWTVQDAAEHNAIPALHRSSRY